MQSIASLLVALALTLVIPRPGVAGCGDEPGDLAAVASTRSDADAACDAQQRGCTSASNHGRYVSCVREQAKLAARNGTLPGRCKGAVVRCAAQSACGKPGATACCLPKRDGGTRCAITKRCAERGGSPSAAPSCCDACGAATTTTTTSTTTPPTSTTLPCQYLPFSCVGSCSGDGICEIAQSGVPFCGCVEPPTCRSSTYPTCDGHCPGGTCQAIKTGGSTQCYCVTGTCPSGTGDECNPVSCPPHLHNGGCVGTCPPGEACAVDNTSGLACGCTTP